MRAADLLWNFLITHYSTEKKYFDFGISTEKGGAYLNSGLAAYKESFGARAVMYDTYEVDVANNRSPSDPP
jgi:hypothetical protein